MLIRNIKSKEDYQRKIAERNRILEVEINNEKYLESMNRDYTNPNFTPVPPVAKTQTELLNDRQLNIDTFVKNLIKLGYDPQLSNDLARSFSIDEVVRINTMWGYLERFITKNFNVKYVTPKFLKNFITNFLNELQNKIDGVIPENNTAVDTSIPISDSNNNQFKDLDKQIKN
jgi:hypothetical protein